MNKFEFKPNLLKHLGLNDVQLKRLLERAPHTYKVYTIPKRSGGRRVIAQPARETKYLQNWLVNNYLLKLPIHNCAMAYKKNVGIKQNASAHRKNKYLIKLDFSNFFPSITISDLIEHFSRHQINDWTKEDIKSIARICCIRNKASDTLALSIGAPSSPPLSNTIMYEFDCLVSEWCNQHDIVYTRYADDLTFSTNIQGKTSLVEAQIKIALSQISYPKLSLNDKKTVQLSNKHKRMVTGVVINNEKEISLGRERKRIISSMIHKFSLSTLSQDKIYELQGLLGFARDIEPLFLSRMRTKYGADLIKTLLTVRKNTKQ